MKTKKISWGFMVMFVLLTVFGCTVNEEGVSMQTINIVANQNDWVTTTILPGREGHYMYQEFAFPEINDNVLNNGVVLVTYIDNHGRDNLLPLVMPYEGDRYDIMENVRYECERGILTIIIECSDFSSANRTSNMNFKVNILSE
jgi:hypothetical protein